MRFFKRQSKRSHLLQTCGSLPDRPRSAKRGCLRLESLEGRKLMAAAFLDAVDLSLENTASSAQPAAVSTATQQVVSVRTIVPYIVNGQNTVEHDNVGIVNGGCSGTLMSPTHVLTAAHCVETSNGGVIGDREGSFEVGGETYNTVQVISHPDYDTNTLENDIAVMELDRPVQGITPATILREAPQIGQTLTIVGFGEGGTTGNPVFDFGNKRVGETPIDGITDTLITWNFEAGESNTAPGDSGGPAFVTIDGQQFLAGVTSGGSGNPHALGDQSFDTRVDAFAPWIDAQVGESTPVDASKPVDADEPVDPTITPVDPPEEPTDAEQDPVDEGLIDATPEQLALEELAEYDSDNDGALSLSELTDEFIDYGLSVSESMTAAEDLLESFDSNSNGALSLNELTVSWGGEEVSDPVTPEEPIDPVDGSDPGVPVEVGSPEQLAWEELELYDANGSGTLSAAELTDEFLSLGLSDGEASRYADSLVAAYDEDGDDQLSYTELVVSWGGDVSDGDIPADLDSAGDGNTDPLFEQGDNAELSDAEISDAEISATEELNLYDVNEDGALSTEELKAEFAAFGLDQAESMETVNDLMDSFDLDGDNALSYSELVLSWGGEFTQDEETVEDSEDFWSEEIDWWESAFALDF